MEQSPNYVILCYHVPLFICWDTVSQISHSVSDASVPLFRHSFPLPPSYDDKTTMDETTMTTTMTTATLQQPPHPMSLLLSTMQPCPQQQHGPSEVFTVPHDSTQNPLESGPFS